MADLLLLCSCLDYTTQKLVSRPSGNLTTQPLLWTINWKTYPSFDSTVWVDHGNDVTIYNDVRKRLAD